LISWRWRLVLLLLLLMWSWEGQFDQIIDLVLSFVSPYRKISILLQLLDYFMLAKSRSQVSHKAVQSFLMLFTSRKSMDWIFLFKSPVDQPYRATQARKVSSGQIFSILWNRYESATFPLEYCSCFPCPERSQRKTYHGNAILRKSCKNPLNQTPP
jgi:hypothetical protein